MKKRGQEKPLFSTLKEKRGMCALGKEGKKKKDGPEKKRRRIPSRMTKEGGEKQNTRFKNHFPSGRGKGKERGPYFLPVKRGDNRPARRLPPRKKGNAKHLNAYTACSSIAI